MAEVLILFLNPTIMRYMITFRSAGESKKRKKIVSQEVGEKVVQSFINKQNIIIDGDWYNAADVENVQKIEKKNGYNKDFVEQQERSELLNPVERKYLESKKLLTQ